MFGGIINRVKSAASGLVLQYLARASVAIPFVIAIGFVLAALAAYLVDTYGRVPGYLLMAVGLGFVGVVAALFVSIKEHEEEVAEELGEKVDTPEVVREVASEAIVQAPLALLGTVMSMPGGPATALKAVRVVGRNLPLVVLLVGVGFLIPTLAQRQAPRG